jgi:hypothetical protein
MSDLALKIKPPRPKCKRVGRYLYVEFPGGETYVFGVRNARSDTVRCHFQVTPSGCGQYATADGKVGDKPVQYALALDDGKHGTMVAGRWSDDSTWWFWDGDSDTGFVPLCQVTLITNKALIAAALVPHQRIPHGLMKFLGLESPALCNGDLIHEMQDSPRYALLRKYDFRSVTPDGPVGKGRIAENRVRHRYSNYEAMLACGGGLLHPEAYSVLRKGVDRLVKEEINKATNGAGRP